MIHNRVGAELVLLSCLSEPYAHPYWAPFILIGNWK